MNPYIVIVTTDTFPEGILASRHDTEAEAEAVAQNYSMDWQVYTAYVLEETADVAARFSIAKEK